MLTADFAERLAVASAAAEQAQFDAVLVTPGPNLRYLVGYDAVPLERLTCLVIRPGGTPVLVAPALERAAAEASPAGAIGIDIATWGETDDPYALVASLANASRRVAVDDHMWAAKVLGLRDAMPGVEQVTAGRVVNEMRMRKSPREVQALQAAADAIDRVHAAVPGLLRRGRSEREIGRDIAELIVSEGHVRVDFVIVASGPNGASPHHEVSDRRLEVGDAIVVDIGGTTDEGYCSDETRTYALGDPGDEYRTAYAALQASQAAATNAVRPGVPCESIDDAARASLVDAGLGSTSSTARATASAWRLTRSPTSSRAMFDPSSPAWRSVSSPASTSRDALERASRTSSCAVPTERRCSMLARVTSSWSNRDPHADRTYAPHTGSGRPPGPDPRDRSGRVAAARGHR